MHFYTYTNLSRMNWLLYIMLFIPAIFTIVGIFHGLGTLFHLNQFSSARILDTLPNLSLAIIHQDNIIRFTQITLTLIMLTYFFCVWLYYARRNVVVFEKNVQKTWLNSIQQFGQLILGIFFALRMMLALWRKSQPDQLSVSTSKYFIQWWWLVLIVANICKITGVVKLSDVDTVGAWSNAYVWMLAAYVFYFVLYCLTLKLINQLQLFHHCLAHDVKCNEMHDLFNNENKKNFKQEAELSVESQMNARSTIGLSTSIFTLPIGGRSEKKLIGPYTLHEGLGVVKRNIFGPTFHNHGNVDFIPQKMILNDITSKFTLGLGGDVMMMFGHALIMDQSVKSFFAECDAMLLNMEGVITDHKKRGPDQKHDPQIIQQLATLFRPDQTWLSFANNHSADFGREECFTSIEHFKAAGFHCFGTAEKPYADIHPNLRVITGTQWSNKPTQDLAWLDQSCEQYIDASKFNLLYPHWGYEMECYPRYEAVKQMSLWLNCFDSVIGHHSHTPQPIQIVEKNHLKKIAAYSLGDFCFGMASKSKPGLKHYPYGLVIKVQIGPLNNQPGKWAVGQVDWSFIDCDLQTNQQYHLKRVEKIPYFK